VGAYATDERRASLGLPVTASIVLHAAIVAFFFMLRPGAAPPSPPIYRVNMVAAPRGPIASGVVTPTPTATPAITQPTPVRPKIEPKSVPLLPPKKNTPVRTPQQATPTATVTPTKPAPQQAAGGGEAGGKGADVANVNLSGIDFPFPGYLENIVRRIALNFKPSVRGALHAEVTFVIRRDGSVDPSAIRLTERSGNYEFDLDAKGAVEAAANNRGFGPLPQGFTDDALPVIFLFDPALIRR